MKIIIPLLILLCTFSTCLNKKQPKNKETLKEIPYNQLGIDISHHQGLDLWNDFSNDTLFILEEAKKYNMYKKEKFSFIYILNLLRVLILKIPYVQLIIKKQKNMELNILGSIIFIL